MPIRIPFPTLTVPVRQIAPRVSASKLAGYSAAVVLLPQKPSATDWATVPHGPLLRELYARKVRKAGDCCQLRVGARAETLLVAACPPVQASTFERLQLAGKIARVVVESDPTSLLLWQQGCDVQPARASLNAAVAAFQAAAFRLASFKSKPNRRPALARIDIAAAPKLEDLDVTLASAAGNNLARWLTALPPNTLDAAGYRRLAKDLARHL